MQTRLLHEDNGQRTFAVILETGEPAGQETCNTEYSEVEVIPVTVAEE